MLNDRYDTEDFMLPDQEWPEELAVFSTEDEWIVAHDVKRRRTFLALMDF